MNSKDRPHTPRRVCKDERPKSTDPSDDSCNIVIKLRNCLNKLERKVDKITSRLDGTSYVPDERPITSNMGELLDDLKRLDKKLSSLTEKQEDHMACYENRTDQLRRLEQIYNETRMERDVLQENTHSYLEQISSLKSKIEEQRCTVSAYERQINSEYETHLMRFESQIKDLKTTIMQKDKQLKDANDQLKQLYRALKSHEMFSWRKKTEESVFISILKNDLQAIWNEKIRLEDEFRRLKKMCGYKECDTTDGKLSEDQIGNRLRKSKSTSDLTLNNINESDGDRRSLRKDSRGINTPARHSAKNPVSDARTPWKKTTQEMPSFEQKPPRNLEGNKKKKEVRDQSVSTLEPLDKTMLDVVTKRLESSQMNTI